MESPIGRKRRLAALVAGALAVLLFLVPLFFTMGSQTCGQVPAALSAHERAAAVVAGDTVRSDDARYQTPGAIVRHCETTTAAGNEGGHVFRLLAIALAIGAVALLVWSIVAQRAAADAPGWSCTYCRAYNASPTAKTCLHCGRERQFANRS